MQEKIGVIAQAFGCTSGTIETSPCTGKWRGTSDISIRFDNGSSLFLGNHMTRKAKTKKVQQELVDSALVRYNPEIIRVAKETAYTALKERELQDNAIAAEKGLKPYTLLNVEFNDGADQQSSGYIGWYYATLAVDGKICTHLETGLNHDIASGSVSPTPTRENYYAAGALKESDVDYVFNNVGFSSASGLYSLHLGDAARGRAELELAKKLIDDYCREEFHSGADFSDLSAVGIGHTTITDDEIPIQAYANLTDFRVEKYLGDVLIESRQYESLAELIQGELNDLEFGDLTYAGDEQLAMFHAQEEVSGKEAPSLDPAVQPVVTILWSESEKLQEGEQLPLARADALFKALDEEKRSEREKPGYTGGWYDKTKFRIDCTFHGERDSYEGRQDFGDGDGALIDHIQAYHEYYAKDENWKNFVLHNEGAEAWEKDKAERETLLTEFVPYMCLHCNLSEQERTAADMLENGENLTPEQTAYFHAVLAHVDACREMYARDTSKKIRATWQSKGKSGEHLTTIPPYGYMKSPADKKKWSVDEEAAAVVQKIFSLCASGKGPTQIAKWLKQQQILNPTAHCHAKGLPTSNKPTADPYKWTNETVSRILERVDYLGHTVNFKTTKQSYKSKKKIWNDPENWMIFENTQPPIIEESVFLIVQNIRKARRRPTKMGEMGMFSGLLYCAECGGKMYQCRATNFAENQKYFICSTYRKGKDLCTTHSIKNVVLHEIVLRNLREAISYVSEHEAEFIQDAAESDMRDRDAEFVRKRETLAKADTRIAELDRIISRLYEDNVIGKLSDERFIKMSHDYELEQSNLKSMAEVLRKDLKQQEQQKTNVRAFIAAVKKYTDLQELDAAVLRAFIDRIEVSHVDKKSRTREITIVYNFIGAFDFTRAIENARNTSKKEQRTA